MTLLLWANLYVKAGHADADLYNAISITEIPMLSEFDPRRIRVLEGHVVVVLVVFLVVIIIVIIVVVDDKIRRRWDATT